MTTQEKWYIQYNNVVYVCGRQFYRWNRECVNSQESTLLVYNKIETSKLIVNSAVQRHYLFALIQCTNYCYTHMGRSQLRPFTPRGGRLMFPNIRMSSRHKTDSLNAHNVWSTNHQPQNKAFFFEKKRISCNVCKSIIRGLQKNLFFIMPGWLQTIALNTCYRFLFPCFWK